MKFIRILVGYIIKYLCGFVCVLGCSVLLFCVAKDNIKDYVITQEEMNIQEGIQSIEKTIEKLDIINQNLYENENFSPLLFLNGELPKKDILRLKNCRNLLTKNIFMVDGVPNVFVVFKNNDLIISNSQCSTSFSDYYKDFLEIHFHENEKLDAIALKTELFERKSESSNFHIMDIITYTKEGVQQQEEEALLYLSNEIGNGSSTLYVFCAVIPKAHLVNEILAQDERKEGFLLVENTSSGEVLVSYGDIPENITNVENQSTVEEYYVLRQASTMLGWNVAVGVPKAYISAQMAGAQSLMMVYLILGLFVAVGLALYFSLARYWGFKSVFSLFPKEETEVENISFNEYKILSRNVERLDRSKREYRLQVEELKEKNQTILLEKIMTKGIQKDSELCFFREYFGHEPEVYCMMLVSFGGTELVDNERIVVDMIHMLLEKNVCILGNIHSIEGGDVFLVELEPEQKEDISGLQKVLEEVIHELCETNPCTMHIGISAAETELSNMGRCYEQANRMVRSLYLYENENRIQTFDVKTNFLRENPISIEVLSRLYTALICGLYAGVERELNRIEKEYMERPYFYEKNKERVFWTIHNVFYTVMLHLNCAEWQRYIPAFSQNLNCPDMMSRFKESAAWICDYISSNKKSKNDNLKEKIWQYLEDNYMDSGLSAYQVSQQVGISEKYLFQFWKEQNGETFAASLRRIRINKAMEYLEQTDFSNEQIASLTGFATTNTFYTNFQKLVGVTPKAYKENRTM